MNGHGYAADIKKAHKEGVLFAHMFEFMPHQQKEGFPALCKVLSGKRGGEVTNRWRDVEAAEEGYRGLAATALKRGVPVPVWEQCSHVGLLFDGNAVNDVNPVHVSSRDALSQVKGDRLEIRNPEIAAFKELADMQDNPVINADGGTFIIDFSKPDNVRHAITCARRALPRMWQLIEGMPWEEYFQGNQGIALAEGINEVNLIAHLRGVKGIILTDPGTRKTNVFGEDIFAKRVHQAIEVRDWLAQRYPEIFVEPLPVFSYNPRQEQAQLVEMSPRMLEVSSGRKDQPMGAPMHSGSLF